VSTALHTPRLIKRSPTSLPKSATATQQSQLLSRQGSHALFSGPMTKLRAETTGMDIVGLVWDTAGALF